MDELLTWSPEDILGDFRKVDSSSSSKNTVEKRLETISAWYHDGGILIMGYELFRRYIQNKTQDNKSEKGEKIEKKPARLSPEQHEQVMKHLLEGPNIIIADEAHKMKNAKSAITRSAVLFKSKSRIALTGSPLANNVEEYHTMIDWVVPNYLGPAVEFRAKYVEPIQQGLWHDSDAYERRKSLKMLGVLRVDLAPKVHRADMSVLRNDLPPKKEFVITVPLTNLQKKAYIIYVREMLGRSSYARTKDGDIVTTTIWHWLAILSLLCNHPDCFNSKLQEREGAASKKDSSSKEVSRENTDQDEVVTTDLNESIWKVGVSRELVTSMTELFKAEAPDIKAIELSNKVKVLCQILDAARAAGDKVLVFSQSLETLKFLKDLCKDQGRSYDSLDGNTKIGTRLQHTKDFNTGDTEIYFISTAAGGLGLNLPGANRVVIFDFKWNPILEEQAVGRAYRIGQKKPVFVYRLVAGGTFENSIHNKTVFKTQLASRVVDKKNPIAWASKKLSDFLFEPKHVEQTDLSEFEGMDPNVLDKILATQSEDSTIRAIVQSDTFERDDEDKLTLEEQKEVDQLVSDKQLERSDPVAFRAMVAKRINQSYALRRPILPLNGVQYQNGLQNQASTSTGSAVNVAQTIAGSAPTPAGVQVSTAGSPQQMNGMAPTGAVPTMQPVHAISSLTPAVVAREGAATNPETSTKTVSIQSAMPTGPTVDSSTTASPPARGRSPITGANTKLRSVTPEGRSPPSLKQGLSRRPQSVTPPAERSRSASISPLRMTKSKRGYSKSLYEFVGAALTTIAARPGSSHLPFARNPLAAAGRISADIMELLTKYTEDKEAMKAPYNNLKAALQADPEKCETLAVTKSSTKAFVLSFVDNPVDPEAALAESGMDGNENVRSSRLSIPPLNKSVPRAEAKAPAEQSHSPDLTKQRPFELYSTEELQEYSYSHGCGTDGSRADMIARYQAKNIAMDNDINLESIAAPQEVVAPEVPKEPQSQENIAPAATPIQPPPSPHSNYGSSRSLGQRIKVLIGMTSKPPN
jgi:superfamily II DNA or RNA helicase